MRIAVLGAGLVGSAICRDLAAETAFKIKAVDLNKAALNKLEDDGRIETVQADLRRSGVLADQISDSELVICAVPGFMGFETLKGIIEAGKNVVDISFFSEDPFELDELAISKEVIAIVDCGVAPGLSNIILGQVAEVLDETESFICYVGGLPTVRHWPYEFKTVFSPWDVLEEYTRPSRFIEYGQEVVLPALSEVELIDFPNVGTLEAFNTDGLRSLAKTMKVPFMKEKTLRYPGYANLMSIFRQGGFFDTDPVEVGGQQISPMALTSKLLFDQWRLKEGEEDITVMQVIVEGRKDGKKLRYIYDLLDRYDRPTRTTAMARTTGYTCTIVARQVLDGLFTRPGINPPEFVGRETACFEDLLKGYQEHNIHLIRTVRVLDEPQDR
jgi:saccharopine dehydrogenase-like NADP-dependent oxidoreductase